ncbi:hypothetical protein DD238_000533 [Peronospora effusa]|uniref:SCP domain-containing protein n=1 Tax=Peronospora effusa TaxID=542832 RepID=A0A3M6VP65_9STRA|nr:hypothetical protein DD238_000533 [Peronospora effusa]
MGEMLSRLNVFRAQNGLNALTVDNRLVASSALHSKDQAVQCRMTHASSDGSTLDKRIGEQGYRFATVTENVAAGQETVVEVMTGWKNSPRHRANLLNNAVVNVGFAKAVNTNCNSFSTYWTQDFAAIVAMTLRSFPVVGVRTQVHYKWQSNCDYVGGDLKAVGGISSTCGHLCVIEEKCTHWSWTDVNGGTCWLKQSKAASISKSAGQGFCGYITDRNPVQDIPPPIEQNPVQDIPPPIEQNPVQDIPPPVEQKPVQKADPPTASPAPPCDNGLTTADNAKMLSSLNSYRADNGLAALAIDNRLAAAALVHSQYQAKYCVMQHEGTDGSTPGDRMKSQNYVWSYCAENVAAGQANVSEVMKSWWNSEHHRENILRVTVTHVGFALVSNEACEYKRFWTQDFGAEQTA